MLLYFALFIAFSILTFVGGSGVWTSIRCSVFGFFGIGLYLFDILLLSQGIILALGKFKRSFVLCVLGMAMLLISYSSLITVFFTDTIVTDSFSAVYRESYDSAYQIPTEGLASSGGIIGGVFGGLLLSNIGKAPSAAVFIILFVISFVLAFNIGTSSVGDRVASGINNGKERFDRGKNELAKKHSAEQSRRRELRDIRSQERRTAIDERRLRQLEERRNRLKERNDSINSRKEQLSGLSLDFLDDTPESEKEFDGLYVEGLEPSDEKPLKKSHLNRFGKKQAPAADTGSIVTVSGKTIPNDPGGVPANRSKSSLDEPFRVVKDSVAPYNNYDLPRREEKPVDAKSREAKKKTANSKKTPDAEKIISEAAKSSEEAESSNRKSVAAFKEKREYLTPPIDCLNLPLFNDDINPEDEMREIGAKLIDTLKSFGVETRMVGASRGPSVTRYELQPAMGVRINKITNLSDDIALNLATAGIRIEAPIPGKSAVGIEVPNKTRATVYLREIVASPEYERGVKKSKLCVAIGKDIAGQVNCADLSKMPHLLVAGTTGSGKSVTMNDMIVSLLYNASPDEVKILLIDPKQVEFSVYNGIPHLYVPVISDARKASGALTWAVTEMERRYKLFSICGVRDLASYNKYISAHPDPDDIMHVEPQVVIFIDELADLMMVSPKEVEDAICRLAQKARAAGMHLVVATQRPSVDVVTGLIKANIPSRLALSVSSQIDSRTILDTAGAEKLLGNGDLLFNPLGVSKPIRIQGAFVSDEEIERIVDFLKEKAMPDYDSNIMEQIEKFASEAGSKKGSQSETEDIPSSGDKVDALFDEVLKFACETGEISGSLIMRKFSLGYGRSAKIIDQMLERGYLGDVNTSTKKRPVLLTIDKYWEMQSAAANNDIAEPEVSSSSTDEQINLFDEPVGDDFDIFADD